MKEVNKARSIPEVLEMIKNLEGDNDQKARTLLKYDSKGMRWVVNSMYNVDFSDMKVPNVRFNNRPPEICMLNINNSIQRLESAYHFRNSKPEITERNLSIVLNEVSKPEAELLISIFKGKKQEGVSKSVFKKAYPQFFRREIESNSDETQLYNPHQTR